jgi:hypothetical protein
MKKAYVGGGVYFASPHKYALVVDDFGNLVEIGESHTMHLIDLHVDAIMIKKSGQPC